MKLLNIWYMPEADVEFSWTDVEDLILLSENHYDYKCRELSQRGGMLYGMRNMFHFPIFLGDERDKLLRLGAKITYRLDSSDANILAKCAESHPMLFSKLLPVVKKLNNEWRKINAKNLRSERRAPKEERDLDLEVPEPFMFPERRP
jgi:hypothetical protein